MGEAYAPDAVDRRLIDELARDARCPVSELATRVGIGRATAYTRLERLRNEGVVEGFTVRVDHRRLGLGITALLLVRVDQPAWRPVADALRELPGAEWLAATAGEFDFVMLVRAADVAHLRAVVLDRIVEMEGVRSSETVLVLEDRWLDRPVSARPAAR